MNKTRSTSTPVNRRHLLAGGAALLGGSLLGRVAEAATTVTWMGWQGYDDPLKAGTFLADNGIDLATTYINANEEIITKLQAGGAGQLDLATIYFGHVPILTAADLIEAIDEKLVPGLDKIFPEFLSVDSIRRDGKLYAIPFTWGTLPMIYDPAVITTPPSHGETSSKTSTRARSR
jgi:spermidine/putrescine-binding protein